MEYEIIYLAPDKLKDYQHNNKIHSEEQLEKLAEIFDNFGFDVPVVIDENFEIIKGHGRKYAAIKKGMEKIPAIIRDDLTDEQKRAARIADNKLSESEWDMEALKFEFESLKELGVDINLTGFDPSEVDVIIGLDEEFSFNSDGSVPDDIADVEGEKEGRSYAIEMSFSTKENAEFFLKYLGMKDYKFKGHTKLVDEDDLDLSFMEGEE